MWNSIKRIKRNLVILIHRRRRRRYSRVTAGTLQCNRCFNYGNAPVNAIRIISVCRTRER